MAAEIPSIVPREPRPPVSVAEGEAPELSTAPAVDRRAPLRRRPGAPADIAELHLLLEEMQDERSRSRMREALWISLAFHLAVVILFLIAPKVFPELAQKYAVVTPTEQINDKDVSFLDLPKDEQKPVPPPPTNIISDKNRVAQARTPSPDRHTLEELEAARRRGAPGLQAPQGPPQPQPVQQAAAQPQQQPQGQPAPQQQQPQQQSSQNAQTFQQPRPAFGQGAFQTPGTASQMIQQAARAAAGRAGEGGDYGIGPLSPNTQNQGAIDILSDTLGVDFGPYLQRVLHDVKENWYNIIPEVARAPLYKQGKLTLIFAIDKQGRVVGLHYEEGSGDVSLDRAAYGGITASNPFPPLPKEFRGEYLQLRFRFYYNPNRGDIR